MTRDCTRPSYIGLHNGHELTLARATWVPPSVKAYVTPAVADRRSRCFAASGQMLHQPRQFAAVQDARQRHLVVEGVVDRSGRGRAVRDHLPLLTHPPTERIGQPHAVRLQRARASGTSIAHQPTRRRYSRTVLRPQPSSRLMHLVPLPSARSATIYSTSCGANIVSLRRPAATCGTWNTNSIGPRSSSKGASSSCRLTGAPVRRGG